MSRIYITRAPTQHIKQRFDAVPPIVYAESVTGTCVICDIPYSGDARRVTCGSPRCQRRRSYLLHRGRLAYVLSNRERFRRWDDQRATRERNLWLAGEPVNLRRAPGFSTEVLVLPETRPVLLRDAVGLHGALTKLCGVPHQPPLPTFSLIPGDPWCVRWLREPGDVLGRVHDGYRVGDREVSIYLSLPLIDPLPRRWRRGRNRVQIDTVTPLILPATRRTGHGPALHHRELTTATLFAALDGFARRVCGEPQPIAVEVAGSEGAIWEERSLPGHWGKATLVTGRWTVEANYPAARLLEAASVVGLGARVALGYGRVVITPL